MSQELCSVVKQLQRRRQPIIDGLYWLLSAIGEKYEELCTRQQPLPPTIAASSSTRGFEERVALEDLRKDPQQTGTELPLLGGLIRTDAGVNLQHKQGVLGGA